MPNCAARALILDMLPSCKHRPATCAMGCLAPAQMSNVWGMYSARGEIVEGGEDLRVGISPPGLPHEHFIPTLVHSLGTQPASALLLPQDAQDLLRRHVAEVLFHDCFTEPPPPIH